MSGAELLAVALVLGVILVVGPVVGLVAYTIALRRVRERDK